MRTLVVITVLTIATANIAAQPASSQAGDCLRRLERDVSPGSVVTVVTSDNKTVSGTFPSIDLYSSVLYLRSTADSKSMSGTLIPLNKISQISFDKPNPARGFITLLGLGVGAVAGGYIGASSGNKHFNSWAKLGDALSGGTIGGMVGAAGGWEISKHMTTRVTLACW